MAIQGIPVPQTMMSAFLNARNKRIENELREAQIKNYTGQATMRPYEMQLKQAQARQAIANATQAERLSAMFPHQRTGATTGQPGQVSQEGQQGLPSDTGQTGSPPPVSNNQSMPGMTLQNAMAGYAALKTPFPTPVDGYYNTIFGKFKAGETPEEKGKRNVSEHQQEKTIEADVTRANKLKEQADTARTSYGLYKELENLHEKHPGLTGIGPGFMRISRLSTSTPVGAYHQTAAKLQTALGRLASQRGGAAVVQWAGRAKPDVGNSENYNIGMIRGDNGQGGGLGDLNREFSQIDKEYFDSTGKHLRPLWSGIKNIVSMKRPDGEIVPVHKENVNTAKEKYKFKEAPEYD